MAGKVVGLTIGIDLGTTNSCVAVWKDDRIEIIPNDHGNRTTPSCVAFNGEEQLIGEAAVNQAARNPANTIFSVKRLLGRAFSETCVQEDINNKLWQCKVVADAADKPVIGIQCQGKEKQFSPEQVSSMILGKMREIAQSFLGSEVKNAVITVPSYFNSAQRQATKVAATMAGLNVVRIITEPAAAALAYGLDNNIGRKRKKNVLVFDLGGGTFDVTILTIEKGNFEMKSYGGDTHLGGDDFDSRLVEHFIREFQKMHNKDMRESQRAIRRLRTWCEKTKRMLSSTTQTTVEIDALYDGTDFDSLLSRARFEESNRDLFTKCIEHVEDCLKHVSINKNDIDDVVLVGGSTRIPKIQQLLQDCFHGKKLCKSINPDEAVAYGAAILAANLSGVRERNLEDLVLMDVTPLSLGVDVNSGTMLVVIPRNTPIPCMMETKLLTTEDNQISIKLKILEGERARSMDNIFLGEMNITGIPPAPREKASITTYFSVDEDGILTVRAKSETKENEITFKDCVGRFSVKETDQIIQDAERYKKEDEKYRRNAEAKHQLKKLLYHLQIVMKENETKMDVEDIMKMNKAIQQTIDWLESKRVIDCEFYDVEFSGQLALLHAALDSVNSSRIRSAPSDSVKPWRRIGKAIITTTARAAAHMATAAIFQTTGLYIPGLIEAVEDFCQ